MIKIVTDSTADVPQELMERYDIRQVPINIQFGTETYQEGIEIDRPTFYRKLEEVMPTSSQPSPGQLVEVYRPLAEDGHSIISIHVTSKHSGTYQSAVLAKSMLPEADIEVFDSLSISIGTGYQVLAAARAAEEGKSMGEIIQLLEGIRSRMYLYLTPATLKYLQKSGRVGKLAGSLASLLNVKPIIKVEDGLLEAFEKVRTRGKALDRLVELTEEAVGTTEPVKLGIPHAQIPAEAEKLKERLESTFNCDEMIVVDLACSLTVHGGPGVIGIISYRV
ncbi:MAG: DegV family protein [Anaerolineales bacterium]|nr:DegV family protein [Anaerolineales bacterium]